MFEVFLSPVLLIKHLVNLPHVFCCITYVVGKYQNLVVCLLV